MKSGKKAYRLRAVAGVWIAIMIFLIVAMLGWAMDTSYVVYVGQQLQVAADAASLAGAAVAKTDLAVARDRAQATGQKNTAGVIASVRREVVLDYHGTNEPDGDIVTGRYYRWDDFTTDPERSAGDFVETTVLGEVNAVKAVAWRGDQWVDGELPLLFGPIFGVNTTNLSRNAIAMVTGSTGAGLIVLCPDCECSLKFGGNTYLTLTTADGYDGDASIVVDSNATGCSPNRAAVCGSGSSLNIDAPEINIVAEGPESSCWSGDPIVPPLNPGSPYVPDPLAYLPEPDYTLMPNYGCISSTGCYSALICSGGLDQGDLCVINADCRDDPGICEFTSATCSGGPKTCPGLLDSECEVPVSCDPVLFTCTAGPDAGAACVIDADCGNWTCDILMNCASGPYDGAPCFGPNECTDAGTCVDGHAACYGGADADEGISCTTDADCPGGECRAARDVCNLGDNHNDDCSTNADCPGGECLPTVRARPGYYPGGFRLTSAGFRLILESGVYSLDHDTGSDSGLFINGGHFDATAGVLLHIVNDGVVKLAGNGNIWISPIDSPGDLYEGVSIFQSRTNYNEAVIIGTTNMILVGTYYFPSNPVKISGTGISVGNQLIAWTLYLSGTGTYTIAYDGRNPAPGYKVFLVQ